MIFNSVTYLLFLAVVVGLYWTLPRRGRLWMLFLASLTFYGFWRVEFMPIMLVSAVTDYVVSLRLARSRSRSRRRALLCISLAINLGLLFTFKYLIFFVDNAWSLAGMLALEIPKPVLKIILPLGISFYTFQTISYTVDVYRRLIKPERDFILYATYVVFFPQLVAGPILRAREVVGQLDIRPPARMADIGTGLRRVLYGLFLKTVLADNIAGMVEQGFACPASMLSALDVWTLAFLFGFQIYFDFGAYSHIAIGSAKLMGIHFPENFNFPYMASSPRGFWQRWHISLSSWIRDYLYLPLAGARVRDQSTGGLATAADQHDGRKALRRHRALFLTWAIMGLWHGAAWTFVLWGVYHAFVVFGYRSLVRPWSQALPEVLRRWGGMALTLPIAMLGWVFFRARGVGQAFAMYGKVLDPRQYGHLQLRENTYLVTATLMLAMLLVYLVRNTIAPRLSRFRIAWAALETVAFTIIAMAVFVFLRPISQFIYFQF